MSLRGRAVRALFARLGRANQSFDLPTAPDDVVFLGDGLAVGGEWPERFPNLPVRVLGDQAMLIDELRLLLPLVNKPRALVILAGTADLHGLGGSGRPDRALEALAALVADARRRVGAAPIVVVGVPRRHQRETQVAQFNSRAAEVVPAAGGIYVSVPPFGQDTDEGFLVSLLAWDAEVFAGIAAEVAPHLGFTTTAAPPADAEEASAPQGRRRLAEFGRQKRIALFESLPRSSGAVVLLGDSITERGAWDGWLPGMRVANRGVSGDRVPQILERLDTALESPALISLMAGTNDLNHGDTRDPDAIAERFQALVGAIGDRTSSAPLLITGVMPRQAKYAERIRRLNSHYSDIAASAGAEFLDMWPSMSAPNGSLRSDLTSDGIHLNAAGYRVWTAGLRPRLDHLITTR